MKFIVITLFIAIAFAMCEHRDIIGKDLITPKLAQCLAGKHALAALVAFTNDGKFNFNSLKNGAYLRGAGFRSDDIEFIFRPCVTCGNIGGQLQTYKVRTEDLPHHGVILEIREGQWSSDKTLNQQTFNELMGATINLGEPIMILTGKEEWSNIFGADYTHPLAVHYPLIYIGNEQETFDDFVPFAGWTKPTEKAKNVPVAVCDASIKQTLRRCDY
ncbi:N-acetylmuraminidase, putative [Entamoeba histolytica HM-1:IMSS-B]|uniref:N-acetylmuraminidase, putative n=6 Tax=Entamoeba histolytica TaxID=5759 RepID=C4MAZ9_ENTH1|nr:N-acetylmuraminidase, putative [Entamoeba histolytica HM-1:IMSS]EMD42629.1 N-acetylmuraminidase, putative [Entamoeba histolytica KU27]EMH76504.1 N-acetylmuraminidase, putative [Entamoeba histolytica HM-1:IMSS-B]EMS11646.1 N-acetylmuraminidase [Entamoeba histolytica HM-3:IMSS]ENY63859.1 N-acetylmuraminidase, putative [Entamoeba histolytica HM-1:IMSS-A]GAT99058.1 N-acetylmuraminidase putative [Entamoeba histolytica]|eukprot:XP_649837.1 N-acetylmuraminidase, putative [Entamoeba histolytica HM-1:IMSS]